jgi:hypothetical protein
MKLLVADVVICLQLLKFDRVVWSSLRMAHLLAFLPDIIRQASTVALVSAASHDCGILHCSPVITCGGESALAPAPLSQGYSASSVVLAGLLGAIIGSTAVVVYNKLSYRPSAVGLALKRNTSIC